MAGKNKGVGILCGLVLLVIGLVWLADSYAWTATGVPWLPVIAILYGLKKIIFFKH